jgi:hypothetical protein
LDSRDGQTVDQAAEPGSPLSVIALTFLSAPQLDSSSDMAAFQDLWLVYGRTSRPANIGARVDGVLIGDLDEQVQDIAASFAAMGSAVSSARVARLGLALADIMRVLPSLEPEATRAYFDLAAQVARATLVEIANPPK